MADELNEVEPPRVLNPTDGSAHARYHEFVNARRGKREPEAESLLLAAAAAYDRIVASDRCDAADLAIVVAATADRRMLAWAGSSTLLGRLAVRWPEAADAIVRLSRGRQAHQRFAAICCLQGETPAALADTVIRLGLADASSRVRWKAAGEAGSLRKRHLVPEITAAVAAEVDPKAAKSIEFALRLLRDGYILKPDGTGDFNLTVPVADGISSRRLSATELSDRGLDAIVAERQAEV